MKRFNLIAITFGACLVVSADKETIPAQGSEDKSLVPELTLPKPSSKTPKNDKPAQPTVTDKAETATKPTSSSEVIFRAMKDEMDRAPRLALADLEKIYYLEYSIDDLQTFSVSASLGGVVSVNHQRARIPNIRLRVGDYKFDNANYVLSDAPAGSRFDPGQFPLDDKYLPIRHGLWLATDRAYKAAVQSIGRKRAALKNVNQTEELPDLYKAEATRTILPVQTLRVDADKWTERIKALSTVFTAYPEVLASSASFSAVVSNHYYRNSEGTEVRSPDLISNVEARAAGQAKDGMTVRDAVVLPALEADKLPPEEEIRKEFVAVADNVRALSAAPLGEPYSGPVLFEGTSSPQLFAELIAVNIVLPRKPLGEPGRPAPFLASELEGRIGSRILPDFMDVVDDPAQTTYKGKPLFGTALVDDEGIVPKPVKLVEKGKLQNFLLTRTPVKGFTASNGRARMPGPGGSKTASPTNLFITASETVKTDDLRKRFLDMVKQRGKPYGMIIRKIDYPSSASYGEVRRILSSASESGGASRATSIPILVYKVFPDGREELVRGLRFRGLSVRSLKDILAVSDETMLFSYINNMAPFALMGAGGYVASVSIVAPKAILFEDLDLEKPQDDLPKLPVVPPPTLSALR